MPLRSIKKSPKSGGNLRFLVSLSRAFGGAILFSLPVMMTMEMWHLGFHMDGFRLALFTLLAVPLLIGLSYYDGFEDTATILDDVVDMFVAYAVGFTAATVLLFLFGVITPEMSAGEIIGKISVQAVVAGLGAMLTESLLIVDDEAREHAEKRKRSASYAGQLFLMAVGALFLSMSVAPTEEVVLISFKMSYWHLLGLIVLTLVIKIAFLFAIKHQGRDEIHPPDETFASLFFRFALVGYAIGLVTSFYVLWSFGSIDGIDLAGQLKATTVLAFPAAIGASASRLIL